MNIKIILIFIVLIFSIEFASSITVYEYGTYHQSNYGGTTLNFLWSNATHTSSVDISTHANIPLRYTGHVRSATDINPGTRTWSNWIYADGTSTWHTYSRKKSAHYTTVNNGYYVYGIQQSESTYNHDFKFGTLYVTATFYDPNDVFTISGNTKCLNNVTLYINISGEYYDYGYKILNDTDTYSFSLSNNSNYKLIFSDDYEYEFTVFGENIIYNYDGCIQTTYKFIELCENLIPDSEGYYCEYTNDIISCNYFKKSTGILNISNSSATKIEIYTNTFIGQTKWLIDPVVNGTTYIVINPNIAWSLKVIVQNESDESLIDDAMVKVDQDCYCTSGYTTRQKLTVNGLVSFSDMSLQDASLFVVSGGYKTIDISSTNYSSFLSGLSNFSSKTWLVKLAPLGSDNESVWYELKNKVDIHFRNTDGNRTSKIIDTDSQVYLYYENNNTNEEDMTLKFQSSSTHTHFIDVESWNIPYDSIGHKTILNVNFTPYDYSYRAVIYNSSIYGWNITIPLTVRNNTKESEQHYENLSTNLWFMCASDGKIDYRNDMSIGVHACSNNTTLMSVDIELYKDNVLLCYKNLTWADFTNADPQFYYIWNPSFNYISESNYSVRMYGFDRTLLETGYIECYTDNITRKNKLTIIVKNQFGTDLSNAFIYLEDYGSLSTGVNNYNSYENLDNGYYRYKATKPDYIGTGWSDITISDSDEVVTYVLTATDSEAGSATQPQKVNDDALQNLYLIAMAGLLIFVLIGGFKYVI